MYTREVEVTTNVDGVLHGLIAGDLEVGLNQVRAARVLRPLNALISEL